MTRLTGSVAILALVAGLLGNRLGETTASVTTSFDLDLSVPDPTVLADGARLYLPGQPGAGYQAAGTWFSGLTDLVGSPLQYVSETGAVSTAVHRDPYGNPRPGSSATAGIGYAGEWTDPQGLVNLRARAYDPAAGRFVSRDSFGGLASAPQTANRYAYGLGNPYRYTDPSGRFVAAVQANPGLVASVGLQFVPGIGDAYSGLTGLLGYDPLAGIGLSELERAAALAAIAPGIPGLSALASKLSHAGSAVVARAESLGSAFSRLGDLPGLRRVAGRAGDVAGLGRTASRATDTAPFGGGTTFTHYTSIDAASSISHVDVSSMAIGDRIDVPRLEFGAGQNPFLSAEQGDIFVTDRGAELSDLQLATIGVRPDRRGVAIEFSQEAAFAQGIRATPVRPDRGIYTIPGGSILAEPFVYRILRRE